MKKDNSEKQPVIIGPNFLNSWFVYDFELCEGIRALEKTIDAVNRHGYDIVSVTQFGDEYTVFFRRRACG